MSPVRPLAALLALTVRTDEPGLQLVHKTTLESGWPISRRRLQELAEGGAVGDDREWRALQALGVPLEACQEWRDQSTRP